MNTARALKGDERRKFISGVVKALGRGGKKFAETHLGWNRGTIRKGLREQIGGIQKSRVHERGRKKAENTSSEPAG